MIRDGNEEEVSFNVSLATPMNNEVQGAFFHISGTEEGAYDLVSDAQKALADPSAEKDMVNTDQAGATFTGSWEAGSGNNTTFVRSNSFDYANATVDAAETAFAAGTATASVNDPVDGDIYIAQLRGGNNYAVIKITNVDPTDATCVCGNLGKID
ncbi:MAG: hypothetical protein U5L96_04250 [Owenweeksia sp.]|nr:hypothetical protein [Owenweeksia sp.]